MDARQIELTVSAKNHGRLCLSGCGLDFFPPESFGKPSIAEGMGKPVKLDVAGLGVTLETDLPTDRSGRPRWFFRNRTWVKSFLRKNSLRPGDKVQIVHFTNTR